MRFYRLRQWLGILVTLSMLLQTSAPLLALNSNLLSGDIPDTEIPTDTVFLSDISEDESSHSELVDAEIDDSDDVITDGESHPYGPENPNTALATKDLLQSQQTAENTPLMFIENMGQFDDDVLFKLQGGEHTMFFTEDAVWLTAAEPVTDTRDSCNHPFQGSWQREANPEPCKPTTWRGNHIKMSFAGANSNFRVVGIDPIGTTVSFFQGSDPAKWQPDVPIYSGVRLVNVYPGIDIEYTGSNGQLAPQVISRSRQANLAKVSLDIEGADVLSANQAGNMELSTSIGALKVPLFSQMGEGVLSSLKPQTDGKRITIPYVTSATSLAAPVLPDTPTLFYSTFVGGSGTDTYGTGENEGISNMTVDASGNTYLVGSTYSTDLPSAPGVFQSNAGDRDAFVAKISPDGAAFLFVTYLGTPGANSGNGIAIDEDNAVYVVGGAGSDFPVTVGARKTICPTPCSDAFVAKLSTDGTTLVYATYLGGDDDSEVAYDVAVDQSGAAYVTGVTRSEDFLTTGGAFQPTIPSDNIVQQNAFVSKLTPDGSNLDYSTFLAGTGDDIGTSIAVGQDGTAHITGMTDSDDFPRYNAAQTVCNPGMPSWCSTVGDAFITKLTPDGSTLVFSTYLGGDLRENHWLTGAIAVTVEGDIFVTGDTGSSNFYTTAGAFQETQTTSSGVSAFVTKFDTNGAIVYSTFLDGQGYTRGYDIAADAVTGYAYVTGLTFADDFPTKHSYQSTRAGGEDAFVTILNRDGSDVVASTYFGGSEDDIGQAIALNPNDFSIYMAGETASSTDFPITADSADPTYNGGKEDGFVIHLTLGSAPSISPGQDWNVECPFCNVADTQGVEYGINTRTGNFGHMDTALSLPTAGGSLDFRYGYISQATEMYTTTLGNGWVHNHELQLHISDPALTHTVILQAPGGSRFPYTGNGDGTYTKYPGVSADMVYNSGADEFVVTTFNQYEFTFDGDGQLQEQKDPFGNLTTFSYSGGKLHQAVQGSRSLTYSYTGDQLSSVQDNSGRTVTLGYTGDDLTSVTAPRGMMTYQYADGDNLLTDVVDPSGRTVKEIAYDSSGRAHELRNGNGDLLVDLTFPQAATAPLMMSTALASPMATAADTSSADLATDVQVVVNGVAMTHVYNSRGVLTDVVYDCADGTAGCGAGSDTGYDYNFKQTAMADANGNDTQLRWNEGGNNIEFVADALGNPTTLNYDSFNNLTQTVDARGITTTLYYDNAAFPTFRTRTVNALGHTQLYTPTVAGVDGAVGGLLKAEQDVSGVVTSYQYNDQGQILETVRAVGTSAAVATSYGYDTLGRLITTTQAAAGESHTTLNVYNSSDRLEATISNWTGSDPAAWASDCDTSSGMRDSNVCTRYGYDAAGRTISTTNTLGQTSLSLYDGAGRSYLSVNNWDSTPYSDATALTDLCDFTNPDPEQNLCSLTEYDSVGRVVTTTNSLGIKNVTEYDSLGRVGRTVSNWDDGVFEPGGYIGGGPFGEGTFVPSEPDRDIETRYEYDAVGNTVLVTDTMGSATRTFYDELNRVSGSIDVWSENGYTLADCFSANPERDEDICTGYVYDEVGNTIIVTDTLGRLTRTFYDELNRTEATVSNWNPATLSSADACVVAADNMQDENICTLYGYDTAGRQITTTNALNQTSLTVYDGANRPYLTVQNWDGTPINSEADCLFPPAQADTNLCSVTYFDALGRRSSSKNPMGQVSDVAYDGLGRVITSTQYLDGTPVAQVTEYDALGNRLSSTDAEQHTASFVYDSLNRLQTTTSAAGVEITQVHNAAGWVITTTNGLGHSIVNSYDPLGRRLNSLDAEANLTQYEYDGLGNQEAVVDAEGIRTQYFYNSTNQLTGVSENMPDYDFADHETNVSTSYWYDAAGNRLTIENGLGITSQTTEYDDLNRPIVVVDALGIATYTQYNALSYPVVMTDGKGAVTTYAYDGLNRVTDVAYVADGETVSTAYNALGQRLSMTDTNGTTTYKYDDLNRLTVVVDTFGAAVGYGYDLNGNRTQLVYPPSAGSGQAGKVVTYTYDADNRLDSLLDWSGGLTDYAYDEAGRLITTTLPNGVVSVNGYDDANRLTSLRYVDDGGSLLAEYLYELDGVGNRTVVTETLLAPGIVETVEAFLEENGQLVLEAESATTTEVAGQGWLTQTAQSGYAGESYLQALPDVGQRLEDATNSPQAQFTVNIQTPGDYTVWARGMAPDAGGDSLLLDLDGSSGGNGALSGFTDEWDWTKLTMANADASLTLSSGVHELTAAMREDGLRLDKLLLTTDSTVPSGSGPVESSSQTITTTNTAPQLGTHVITYDYDPLYRLTEAVYSGDISASYGYGYDAVGNMAAYTETLTTDAGQETSVVNRAFNDANQLTSATDTVLGTTSYYYDDNGNMTQILPPGVTAGDAGEQLYSFNQRNLLTDSSAGSGGGVYDTIASFVYDGNGDRIQQVDHSGNTPITTTYTNDNSGLSQVLVADDGSTQTYNLFGLDLISQDDGNQTRTLLADGLGSTRLEMVGGLVETTSSYEPFGKLLVQAGDSGTVYGYTGERYDSATNLVFLRARYYSPDLKVFMSRDPYAGSLTVPASQHGYSYAHNNPVNLIDPSGEQVILPLELIALFILGVAIVAIIALNPVLLDMIEELAEDVVGICHEQIDKLIHQAEQLNPESEEDPTPIPPIIPTPQPTPTPDPNIIYRWGRDRAKSLTLHQPQHWETGLSFATTPPVGRPYIKFRISTLEQADYIVRPDAVESPIYKLWGKGPFLDPNTGKQRKFGSGHVTVYHRSQTYWDNWHQADLANKGTTNVSIQAQAIYALREH